jgi:MarR family transcriptional repressor of emrRAB
MPEDPRIPPATAAPAEALSHADGLVAGEAWEYAQRFTERADDLAPGLDAEALLVFVLLARVARITAYDFEASVHRPAGLNYSSFYVVAMLAVAGPLESSSLARATGMSRAAVSAMTKTLERDGWIERSRSAGDGRAVVLSLTTAGRDRAPDLFRTLNERESAWASGLSGSDRRELVRLLRALLASAPADTRERR